MAHILSEKNKLIKVIQLSVLIGMMPSFFACYNPKTKKKDDTKNTISAPGVTSKPPSTYSDTLFIKEPAAVFFSPDSAQLEQYKAVNTQMVFESTTHEYFYLFKTAMSVLKRNWAKIQIIETSKARYLQFIKSDGTSSCIDLNIKNDISGLYVFDTKSNPQLVDMMNIETELEQYFKK